MSKLDDLIKELCPNGVEYKTIDFLIKSKIVKTITPTLKIKRNDYRTIGKMPIISQEVEFISGYCNFEDKNIPKNNYVCFGDHSEHIKFIDFAFVQGADGLKIMLLNENEIVAKYFFYAISNYYKKHNNYERHFKYLQDTEIPVPPLEVQSEIVRILDKFTELEEELEFRRKQYEYYRNSLFTFGEEVEWKTLGEIATEIYRGSGIKKDEVTEEGISCVRYGEIYTKYNIHFDKCFSHTILENISSPKYFEHGDILFAITGESVEDIAKSIAYMGNEKCLAGGDIVVMKHNQNPKYLSFALSTTDAIMQKGKGKVKSKVVHSSVPAISEIKIPLPSLEEQERIASILDRFHSLCNDITQGLPAEIEARRKQYEYYRDKLLTFERKAV